MTMLSKTVTELLKQRHFINVATCDREGKPNAIPKFILKVEGNHIFLVDYTIGRTYANLKNNPRISLCFFNTDIVKGFQINGTVEVIEKGETYETIRAELEAREVSLATERILKGLSSGKRSQQYEIAGPKKFVIFKMRMEEVIETTYSGEVNRENLKHGI